MESEDKEEMCTCLIGNTFHTERFVTETTEDENDPDFKPEQEKEKVSIAEFVKKRSGKAFFR
jgi:hypothetical protein